MTLQDLTIKCFECGRDFTFTTAEQEEFRAKAHNHPPKRCPACREVRKAKRATRPGPQNTDFAAPRRMFATICTDCGKPVNVPFQPRGDKPVYCSDCFRKVRQSR